MSLSEGNIDATSALKPNVVWRVAPVITLLVLSPVITNVDFGAIRMTNIVALLPAIGAWGCGSLLIREVVRRRGQGWMTVLILGMALAMAEECVFLQTSLFPLVGVDPNHVYGRSFGVNWPYLLWSVGYESVWAVVVPILLVEWFFPLRRIEPWMGNMGLGILAFIFVGAGLVRWYAWTQIFIPQFFPASAQGPSRFHITTSLIAIGALVVFALKLRTPHLREDSVTVTRPRSGLVGIAAFAFGLAWFMLLFLAYGVAPNVPIGIPMVAGVCVAVTAWVFVHRWTAGSGWRDIHSLSLVFGSLLASMLAGFLVLKGSNAPTVDYIGKIILNIVSIAVLIWLGKRLAIAASVSS